MKQNKHQEALNYFLLREEGDNQTVTIDWLGYAETLKELVDKEIPMKPVKGTLCGKCDSALVIRNVVYKRCLNPKCEQKVDWSD